MSVYEYKQNEIIFKQGDFATVMYDILSGSVAVFDAYGTEYENQLAVLGAGEFIGEMGMIEAYPRSATAVALEDGTKLREINKEEFSDYFFHQPERALLIMRQLSQRLRVRTEEYQKALNTLNEMKDTTGTPDKRSKSLLDRIKEIFDLYDRAIASGTAIHYEGMETNYPFTIY